MVEEISLTDFFFWDFRSIPPSEKILGGFFFSNLGEIRALKQTCVHTLNNKNPDRIISPMKGKLQSAALRRE